MSPSAVVAVASGDPIVAGSASAAANQKRPHYGSFKSTKSNREQDRMSINSSQKLEAQEHEGEEKASFLLRLAKRVPCLGIIMALFASLFLGSAGMLVKMTRSVHGIQISVFRATIQLLIYGFVISVRKLPLWPDKDEVKPVFGRATLSAVSITCSYYALRLIPLGDATTIRFSLPVWTLIIGYLVLGEPCGILRCVAVVISISGVILIAKPEECVYLLHMICNSLAIESDETFTEQREIFEAFKTRVGAVNVHLTQEHAQFKGSILALSSSVCLAMSLICMRMCRKTSSELCIVMLSILAMLFGTVTLVAMGEWRMPTNWLDIFYILLNGLCGSIGQWFMTNSLKVEQSGIISLVRTFDIEVAFLYSALLLHEHIRLTSIVGSCLVTAGVLAVLVPRWLCPTSSNPNSTGSPTSSSGVPVSGDENIHQQTLIGDEVPTQIQAGRLTKNGSTVENNNRPHIAPVPIDSKQKL